MESQSAIEFVELLKDSPKNWGRWGSDDEIGSLNFLTDAEVLRGVRAVRHGRTFMLGIPVAHPKGDPLHPLRAQPIHTFTHDEGSYISGADEPLPGGLKYSDDVIVMYPQGSTQYDALGHAWCGDHLYKGKPHLDPDEAVVLQDLLDTAAHQKVSIERHDILVVRTGWLPRWYEGGPAEFFPDGRVVDPGLQYSPELVRWFYEMEIPSLSVDNIGCEIGIDPNLKSHGALHCALQSYLGIPFNEVVWLEDLAADCAEDGQYTFLFAGAPLKMVKGAGSAVNPIVIK
jgi:kynurenine formamidase